MQLEIDQEEESRGTKRMSRHASGNTEETAPSKRRRETQRTNDEEGTESVREELEKMTKKYEDLVKKLRDKVECPVCFDVPRKAPIPVGSKKILPMIPDFLMFMARCVLMVMLSAFGAPELNVPPAGFLCKNHCPSNSNVHIFWQSENGEGYLNLGSHCHREH